MKADDLHINEEERFSIGVDRDTGKYYLSFPVHNRLCSYEEFYLISEPTALGYPENIELVRELLDKSRKRENDSMLIIKPGTDRGVP